MSKARPRKAKPAEPIPDSPPALPDPAPEPEPAPTEAAPPAPPCPRDRRPLLFFLAVPFGVFYWCLPFIGKYTLGNDYTIYSIGAQMELLYSIRHGSFPLFFPRIADGISANALTLGQLYHPFTWIAALTPGYWSGHALDLMTLLRLLSLGLVHYALFRLLRRLRVGLVFSLIISFMTVYNLRMLDSMRYGASLENYTAYLLLGAALAWAWIQPRPRLSFLWTALATYLLVVGGHPQFMYFGLIGAGAMVLVLPFYLEMMLPGETGMARERLLRFWGFSYLALAAGIILATAQWLPFYRDYLSQETVRVGLNYDWSTVNQDTLTGTLNTFFKPYHGDVHGTFGGSALILLAAGLPLLFLAGVRIPRIILLIWGLLILTILYQLGSATPVHYFFWRFVPFASSFRVPGRMAFLNPFTIFLLLAWLARLDPVPVKIGARAITVLPIGLLAAAAALVFVFYNLVFLYQADNSNFPPSLLYKTIHTGISYNHIPRMMEILVFASGLASLLILALLGAARDGRAVKLWSLALCAGVAVQTTAAMRYGTWIELRKPTLTLAQMDEQRKKTLNCVAPFSEQGELSREAQDIKDHGGSRDARPGALHTKVVNVRNHEEIFSYGLDNPWENDLGVEGGMKALPPLPLDEKENSSLKLTYSSFNRLVFEADCSYPAACTLGYPYSNGRWRAWVDGRRVPIYKAAGFHPVVRLDAGKHTVEFRYFTPTPFIGMGVSFAAAIGLIYWVASGIAGRRRGRIALVFSCAFFAVLFALIAVSVYHGQNLGTDYYEFF